MPQYWLKPLGFTTPQPHPVPDDWIPERGLDRFELTTGPVQIQKPPQLGRYDRVLFHAVIHGRVFAQAEVIGKPEHEPHREWGSRWPWVYPCRVDVWVPLIGGGPRTPRCRAQASHGTHSSRGRLRKTIQGRVRSCPQCAVGDTNRHAALSSTTPPSALPGRLPSAEDSDHLAHRPTGPLPLQRRVGHMLDDRSGLRLEAQRKGAPQYLDVPQEHPPLAGQSDSERVPARPTI